MKNIKEQAEKIKYVSLPKSEGPTNKVSFKIKLMEIAKEDEITPFSFREGEKKSASDSNTNISVSNTTNDQGTRIKWDFTKFKIRYFTPPRYLIVEDNYLGRRDLGRIIRNYNNNHYVDLADTGPEAINKFTKMLTQGYIYDYIFMDIDLPDIKGNVVTQMIRDIEKRFGVHTNISAVTVGNLDDLGEKLFDKLCKIEFIYIK